MAKTSIIGNDGTIGTGVFSQSSDNATHNALINFWRASFPRVLTPVTGFAHALVHNRLGVSNIVGSLRGTPLFDAVSTSPGMVDRAVGGSAMTLTVCTGCTYAFTAVFPEPAIASDKMGAAEFETDFANGDSDTLTETWDES